LIGDIYLVNGQLKKDVPTLLFIDEIQNSPQAEAVHNRITKQFINFALVGGMPGVIKKYALKREAGGNRKTFT
jgi:hypothetical protein